MTWSCVSGFVRSIYSWFALFLGHNPLGSQPGASTLSLVDPKLQLLFSYLYGTAKIMAQIFHLWTAAFSKIIFLFYFVMKPSLTFLPKVPPPYYHWFCFIFRHAEKFPYTLHLVFPNVNILHNIVHLSKLRKQYLYFSFN